MSVIRIRKKEKFVILNKEVTENPNLSLKAIGLYAKCMSKPDDWKFYIQEIASSGKEGKKAIYSAIDELIKAGYVYKGQCRVKNDGTKKGGNRLLFSTVEYIFSDHKFTEEEISEFKIIFPQSPKGEAHLSLAEKSPLLNITTSSKEEVTKETYNQSLDQAPPSELTHFFLEKLKEVKPDFLCKNTKKWDEDFDKMVRIDKRDPEKIKQVISWLVTDLNNLSYHMSPGKIREKFDDLEVKKNREQAKALIKKNRDYLLAAREKYPDKFTSMSFDDKFVKDVSTAKDLPFNLEHETFKKVLIGMFKDKGKKYD